MPRLSDENCNQAIGMLQTGMSQRTVSRHSNVSISCKQLSNQLFISMQQINRNSKTRPTTSNNAPATKCHQTTSFAESIHDGNVNRETNYWTHCRAINANTVSLILRCRQIPCRRSYKGMISTPNHRQQWARQQLQQRETGIVWCFPMNNSPM